MHLHCNLNGYQIHEWASLFLLLSSVRFRLVPDSLRWIIYSFSTFFVRSLIEDLMGSIEPIAWDFYPVIWLDHHPKKIKIFFWEHSQAAINTTDHLQRVHLTCLSLHRGVLCVKLMLSPLLICLCIFLLHPISGIIFWMLLGGQSPALIIFSTSLFWWGSPFLVLRKWLGWLFFALSFGLCVVNVISVSLRIQFPLLTHFLILCCLLLFIGARLGTLLRTLVFLI